MNFEEKLQSFIKENLPEETPFVFLVGIDAPEKGKREVIGVLNGSKNTLVAMLVGSLKNIDWGEIFMDALARATKEEGGEL